MAADNGTNGRGRGRGAGVQAQPGSAAAEAPAIRKCGFQLSVRNQDWERIEGHVNYIYNIYYLKLRLEWNIGWPLGMEALWESERAVAATRKELENWEESLDPAVRSFPGSS